MIKLKIIEDLFITKKKMISLQSTNGKAKMMFSVDTDFRI